MMTTILPRARRRRLGVTLPELVIGLVIVGIIGGALVKLLMVQGRFADTQEESRSSRSVARDAFNIMMTDLRMVQDTLAIQAASPDSIKVRVPYRYGLFCANASSSASTISVLPVDSAQNALAVYSGVAWDSAGVFQFKAKGATDAVSAAPDNRVCSDSVTGPGVDSVSFRDSTSGRISYGRTVRLQPYLANAQPGDPVFLWQEITYAFQPSIAYPGRRGLFRKITNGTTPIVDEIIAPFDTSAHFRFYVLNNDSSQAAPPGNLNSIKGLDLRLNSLSPRIPAGSTTPKKTQIRTAVYFKDRRDP